ncbi:hypothetical protein Barb4_02541 [Bacteroidales bacterium Barb4]|nr:hypothetical protein Barb4_02541 [Bacteroidales bacterium Barb4]
MLPTLLLTLFILAVCTALLAIKVLVKKEGRFPDTHLDGNKALRAQGIHCAKAQHREAVRRKTLAELLKETNQ